MRRRCQSSANMRLHTMGVFSQGDSDEQNTYIHPAGGNADLCHRGTSEVTASTERLWQMDNNVPSLKQ
ncbi:hypothetical protein CesoFtcFv8_023570 [Champsocephalus esox]|uniref:Uncharacterized protein n=1 Tax=Champsocephalus esox TaxID=159716 RepID=A0AAN8B8I4_9TELE|nr:hypothetical protein CesoFtcFv8_023570 [Champsocephalus esox]